MPKADRPALRVDLGVAETHAVHHQQRNGSKDLVDLVQIHLQRRRDETLLR